MSNGWDAPGHPHGAGSATPDWAALADLAERAAARRRRLRIGLAALAALAVAGTATAVLVLRSGGPGGDPHRTASGAPAAPSGSTSATGSPRPTAPPTGLHLSRTAQVAPVDGRTGPVLTLPGHSDGYAESKDGAVDTSHGFTVSAVVLNHAATDPKAAVSQGGDAFFSFYLGREDSSAATRNRWVFKVQTAAEPGKDVMALSTAPAEPERWTALTGVYDAGAHSISLYVDGTLAQTVPVSGVLASGGPVELGRARYKSHWVDFWNGSIAEVRIWDHPLTADRVPVPEGAQYSWLTP
ncbi:LamG domain-containing protein [Kitasatospora sp. NPDC058965]|uniref:LamG domain-containing protein n=1 Tax=Kitasatospora sp. NPDC058965 TaxID=3346682 RepID=UPI0036897BC7